MTRIEKHSFISSLLVLIVFVSSCSGIVGKLYGIRTVKGINPVQIREIRKADPLMSLYPGYYIDTGFVNSVYRKFRGDSVTIKDLMQPMQAMYFNEGGQLVSYHINCNAGGFPNLNWNRNHAFDQFYPLTQTHCINNLHPDFIYQNIKELQAENLPQGKTVIIVFWSYQFYKQSRRLMKLVADNMKQYAPDKSTTLIFVNTDLIYQ